MKVHHINCATMCPPAVRLRGTTRLVAHCLLIEVGDRLVLVDTGLGTADVAHPRSRLGRGFVDLVRPALDPGETAVARLAALGFAPADVTDIVCTHLDLDHSGGIYDFPRAHTHVMMVEQEAAVLRWAWRERQRYPVALDDYARWRLYRARGEPWFGFEAVRALQDLPPELLLVPLFGHTRGHAGVAVDTGAGWLLHAGDAYFHHQELEGHNAPPPLEAFQRLLAMDGEARSQNRARLVELHRQHGAQVRVFCAHDPFELAGFEG